MISLSSHFAVYCGTHFRLLNQLGLYQSSGNGSKQRPLPYLWLSELSPYLAHSNARLALSTNSPCREHLGKDLVENNTF
jgi:hypothetical protein